LLQTIQQVVFEKLDTRILAFLKERAGIFGSNHIKISHKQMAQELGTAREVVTRILKKLEVEGKILQHPGLIEIL
jgi:CRP/FNR family transcriptional regulator